MSVEAVIIDGKHIAIELQSELKKSSETLFSSYGVVPGLAIIRVGNDPASEVYVSMKGAKAADLGFGFQEHYFPASISSEKLYECIDKLNKDSRVHGIIIQLPLPDGFDKFSLLSAIDPRKDVDGLHPINMGKLWQGDPSGFVPCTPQGCKILIESVHSGLAGKNALVIGCSTLVGRPMAAVLLNEDATITLAHFLTKDLPELCKKADILVVAIGDPQFIQGAWIKPGATVIDVGINRLSDRSIVGDVDFDKARHVAGHITPVPGGVGPMTVACLMQNTYIAAKRTVTLE